MEDVREIPGFVRRGGAARQRAEGLVSMPPPLTTKIGCNASLASAALAVAGCILLAPASAQAQGYNLQVINNPAEPPGEIFNNLLAINNSDFIAGFYGSGNPGFPNKGFTLTLPSTFTPMNFPGSAQTQLNGLNNTGVIVGYFYTTNNGVPLDNQFGFYEKGGAFIQKNTPQTPANPNPGVLIENQLLGVTDADVAVGFYLDASGNSHGYTYNILTDTFSKNIDFPGAPSTTAAAINNADNIAGFYKDSSGETHGFLDIGGNFTSVDGPGVTSTGQTQILGLNDQGLAVGFYQDTASDTFHGLIFDSVHNTFTTLDPKGSMGTTLNGINDLGDIVGFFVDGANTDGLLATRVPEPATWVMMLVGFAGLALAALRRSRRVGLARAWQPSQSASRAATSLDEALERRRVDKPEQRVVVQYIRGGQVGVVSKEGGSN